MHIFLQALYIGIANNLPTGPVSAYLIATRAQNTYRSIIAIIFGVLVADIAHLYLIGSLPGNHFSPENIHPLINIALSLILIVIGISMVHRGFRPKETRTLMRYRENLFLITIYAFFLNMINPFAIVSMAAFLNASGLLPIERSQALVVYTGYIIASLCMWSIYGLIVQKYIEKIGRYTKNIVIICGITIIMFGFGYISHQAIELVDPYIVNSVKERVLKQTRTLQNSLR